VVTPHDISCKLKHHETYRKYTNETNMNELNTTIS